MCTNYFQALRSFQMFIGPLFEIKLHLPSTAIGDPFICLKSRQANSKENTKALITGPLCAGNPQVTGGFPAQRASSTESIPMSWWPHDHEADPCGSPACCTDLIDDHQFECRIWRLHAKAPNTHYLNLSGTWSVKLSCFNIKLLPWRKFFMSRRPNKLGCPITHSHPIACPLLIGFLFIYSVMTSWLENRIITCRIHWLLVDSTPKGPVTQSFDVSFIFKLNRLLNNQWCCQIFEKPWSMVSLGHYNALYSILIYWTMV